MRRRLALLLVPAAVLLGISIAPAKAAPAPAAKVGVRVPVLCLIQGRSSTGLCVYSLF